MPEIIGPGNEGEQRRWPNVRLNSLGLVVNPDGTAAGPLAVEEYWRFANETNFWRPIRTVATAMVDAARPQIATTEQWRADP